MEREYDYEEINPSSTATKSEWNMDQEALHLVFVLKLRFLEYLKDEDLENAYWTLLLIDSEIYPAVRDENKLILKKELSELEQRRKEYYFNKSEKRMAFYVKLKKVYKFMNGAMIKEGWYFRKKDGYTGL